ncbi:DNA-binding protein [Duncaniella dubosii]|uniref:DNA-binding protein n=1 Tax=Duncaniella dubosii TaxID=2518971 RepID=UPI003F676480
MAKKETGKSFLLRLDTATMEKVEAWAAQEFRSVNGQIQWIIADSLRRHRHLSSTTPTTNDTEEDI